MNDFTLRGQDRVVTIATRYGLDGPGIESRWWRDFPHPSRLALRFMQPPIRWIRVNHWGKAVGAWRLAPPSSADVKERVQLYIYAPSVSSWQIIGRNLFYISHNR
jgi:hypothetical protein